MLFQAKILAFSGQNAWIGNLDYILLDGVSLVIKDGQLAQMAFVIFQMMFAVVAVALISGAIVGRMRFKTFVVFVILWSVIFYSTVVHWVWSESGWLYQLGVMDFAGGLAIHIGAGFSSLVLAIPVKPRRHIENFHSHNMPFVLVGVIFLWFGYYGFNAGSVLAVNEIAFINTALAPAMAILVWASIDSIKKHSISATNVSIAAVVGLVSITPGGGFC